MLEFKEARKNITIEGGQTACTKLTALQKKKRIDRSV